MSIPRAIAHHAQRPENTLIPARTTIRQVFTNDPSCSKPNTFAVILSVSPRGSVSQPHSSGDSKHQMHRLPNAFAARKDEPVELPLTCARQPKARFCNPPPLVT